MTIYVSNDAIYQTPPDELRRRVRDLHVREGEIMAELNDSPGPTPAAEVMEFDPAYEWSPERAVESLRRYTAGCPWVLSIDWIGDKQIEIHLMVKVKTELLRRLPNFVNGYRVNAWDEESNLHYLKIGSAVERS